MCELKGPEHWAGCWREHHACAVNLIEDLKVFDTAYLRWANSWHGMEEEADAFVQMVEAHEKIERTWD